MKKRGMRILPSMEYELGALIQSAVIQFAKSALTQVPFARILPSPPSPLLSFAAGLAITPLGENFGRKNFGEKNFCHLSGVMPGPLPFSLRTRRGTLQHGPARQHRKSVNIVTAP